ncbi:DUF1538 domain-containing protein, partial [Halomonas sp. KM-1]|uniref:DUF1538 domain-containing protein n=1 Tax=Halomonas sp. KM-1 TaxID=590061 RepID=UPI0005557CF6
MVEQFKDFLHALAHALRNLLPIIIVVLAFQALLLREWPEGGLSMALGLLIVALGVALFLQGLELSIFPVGKRLANQFARRGSMPLLMLFGFAIGFSAVIAEPALIAVAEQAAMISEGRIDALTLRLIVASSVGLVMALGVFRVILGHPLHWYMIVGYVIVVMVTFFAPEEIVGLAYDSGGVTTNIVTVPLIAALGIGLAASIRGRNPLVDGFGLVALAVMVPMISVQLYGILVYADPGTLAGGAEVLRAEADAAPPAGWVTMILDLFGMLRDVLPIILVILFFQYAVLRHPLASP